MRGWVRPPSEKSKQFTLIGPVSPKKTTHNAHNMQPFTSLFEWLSACIGFLPPDFVRLLFMFFISYPLAYFYIKLPTTNSRHWYGITISFFFLCCIFDLYGGYLHVLASSLFNYVASKYLRHQGRLMPWIITVVTMIHLVWLHAGRQFFYITSPEVIEITGTSMVLVMKLSAYAWNVHDGITKEELTPYQEEKKLSEVPPLLEYLGFVFYFPGLMVGPSIEYMDYRKFTDLSMFSADADKLVKRRETEEKRVSVDGKMQRIEIPNSKRTAAKSLLLGVFFFGIFGALGPKFSYNQVLKSSWDDTSVLYRILFIQLSGIISRCQFYGAWCLSEGSCILSGLGFNGFNQEGYPIFERCKNIDIYRIETADNMRTFFDGWNKNTNRWLRQYIYLRVTPKGRKPGFISSQITFVVSSLWHGLFPGYLLAFVGSGFGVFSAQLMRRYVRPLLLNGDGSGKGVKVVYDVMGKITTLFIVNYLASSFMLLDFGTCVFLFSRVGLYGHVLILFPILFDLADGFKCVAPSSRN
ncbi:membrane-bound O-acyltransferase [Planoprotostelium fungivorum]|uniref:Membrane-bound O-acyltransferase n=1 Tax=Planoprotostelium fungivorum TaxID=1890364 RepID=A0A2P6N2E3_9EUKA|nr:membrane-bound O-acyltransferase [Planoprotostelium fungivorum]